MADRNDDDLNPSETQGFKVGEKKTIEEYAKLGTGLAWTFLQSSFVASSYRVAHCRSAVLRP